MASNGPLDNRPLNIVLDELGQFYGVFFTYDAEKISGTEVDFQPSPDESLQEAVDRLLVQTGFSYEAFSDKYFVIYEDSQRGLRDSRRLLRKVRQLDRLENRGSLSTIGRAGTDPNTLLNDVNQLSNQLRSATVVTGAVVNETGEPLIGVSIRVAGTSQGTQTQQDGTFSLPLPASATRLEFSYLGYRNQAVSVRTGQQVTIRLQPADTELPEVIIIGYGQIKAEQATGSIAQIERDELTQSQANVSPHEWLQGRVAGVQLLGGNGAPGSFQSIRIRGASSMNAGNEPLYVIDGMPVDNNPHAPLGFQPGINPLNALNPDDVARVSVLKDAAASAIYGSRAANGVVLIETKKSRLYEKGTLNYANWFSVASAANQYNIYGAEDYRMLVQRVAPWRADELGNAATDWQSSILRTAPAQQHTLSFQRGNEQSSYRVSVGYLQQQGIVGPANSRRFSSAVYLRQELFDHQLKIEGDFKVARLVDQYSSTSTLSYAYSFNPTRPILDPANRRWAGFFEYDNDLTIRNPVGELNQVRDESRQLRLLGHVKAEYQPDFIPGLRATLHLGNDVTDGLRNLFAPATVRYQYANQGEYLYARQNRNNRLWESYLHYDKRLAGNRLGLNLTGGYTYQHNRAEYPEQRYLGIETADYTFGEIPQSDRLIRRDFYQENRLASFFGRGNFDWQGRYLFTASLRTDGSSRFSPQNRWATFPAAAFGWRLSEERFLANRPAWIESLKLRAGWGLTGNQEIGDFEYLPTYTYGDNTVRYPFGDEYLVTARPNAVSTGLKWEQTASFNLALEAAFFNDRLTTTVEAYRATTNDLLSRVLVPAGSNLSNVVLTNVGSLRNRGLELSMAARLIEKPHLKWSVNLNLATNQNEILSLGTTPDNNFRAISTGTISGGTGNTIQIYTVGQPLHAFYVFQHRLDVNGRPLRDQVDHNLDGRIDLADIYYDTNADGVVNDRDKRPYQQPAPQLFGGVQSNLRLGPVGLLVALRFQTGNYVYNNQAANTENYDRLLREPELLNVPTSLSSVGFQSSQFFSDFYVEDASFLRLDALTLDYTASFGGNKHPKNVATPEEDTATLKSRNKRTFAVDKLRVYLTAQNLFTITNYRGLDPEIGNVSGNPGVPRFGIDDLMFPRTRVLILGLNSTF